MKVFISGGAKNGKSYQAQRITKALAGNGQKLYYIATMQPHDNEDYERIERHIKEREGWGFQTLECGLNITNCLELADPNGVFLLDSVTALLANEMFDGDGINETAHLRVADELISLIQAVSDIVVVSDYIYSDAARYDSLTDLYRKGLAYVDRQIVQCCDTVIEICAGQVIVHKGGLPV